MGDVLDPALSIDARFEVLVNVDICSPAFPLKQLIISEYGLPLVLCKLLLDAVQTSGVPPEYSCNTLAGKFTASELGITQDALDRNLVPVLRKFPRQWSLKKLQLQTFLEPKGTDFYRNLFPAFSNSVITAPQPYAVKRLALLCLGSLLVNHLTKTLELGPQLISESYLARFRMLVECGGGFLRSAMTTEFTFLWPSSLTMASMYCRMVEVSPTAASSSAYPLPPIKEVLSLTTLLQESSVHIDVGKLVAERLDATFKHIPLDGYCTYALAACLLQWQNGAATLSDFGDFARGKPRFISGLQALQLANFDLIPSSKIASVLAHHRQHPSASLPSGLWANPSYLLHMFKYPFVHATFKMCTEENTLRLAVFPSQTTIQRPTLGILFTQNITTADDDRGHTALLHWTPETFDVHDAGSSSEDETPLSRRVRTKRRRREGGEHAA